MSIGNAIKFIKRTQSDASFRQNLYKVDSWEDLMDVLIKEDMNCSPIELDEAFNHLHVQCQFQEEADSLFNVLHFVKLIV